MSEPTDLEQIAALEERITTALDRIGRAIASHNADVGGSESADEMQERLTALGAALQETQGALAAEQTAHADLSDRLRAVEAARKADADEAARELAKAKDVTPEVVAPDDSAVDSTVVKDLEAEVERRQSIEDVLRRRIGRVREERNLNRGERNEAREQLEDLQGRLEQLEAISGAGGSAKELSRLRQSNRALRDTIEEMREGIEDDAVANNDLVTAALAAELESLRAERASDAAEANAILAGLRPVLEEGTADA